MTRNPLDASGRQHAAGTRLNSATASADAGCHRALPYRGQTFA